MSGQGLLHAPAPRTARPAARENEYAAITRVVVHELAPVFSSTLGGSFVTNQVRKAVVELRSSVSMEALPEMVARLACKRLTSRLPYPNRPSPNRP